MAKNILLCSSIVVIALFVDYTKSECNSDLLRDFAVDACNHINKRSILHDYYQVEDMYASQRYTRHFKKLKREDFPHGGYLRIRHSHYLKHQRQSRRISDDNDGIDILSRDLEHNTKYKYSIGSQNDFNEVVSDDEEHDEYNHKNNGITYRFKRDANKEIPIDYCCTQAGTDICNKYSCH